MPPLSLLEHGPGHERRTITDDTTGEAMSEGSEALEFRGLSVKEKHTRTVERMSEADVVSVLECILVQFPFVIRGFHFSSLL